MDLATFVRETLVQIVEGVSAATIEIDNLGTNARINPGIENAHNGGQARPVEFDVAVTVSQGSENKDQVKAGGSLSVLAVVGIKAGAEGLSDTAAMQRSEAVSRVKFSVMIAQPSQVRPKPQVAGPPGLSRRL